MNRIYISTSGIRSQYINESVFQLASAGYKYIELSGGTKYYPQLESDLVTLKTQYGLSYRCHNYFPPPVSNFVLNLSSSGETLARTLQQIKNCLSLSHRLGGDMLGIHAGFRMDPGVDELGQRISSRELLTYDEAVKRFCINLMQLNDVALEEGVKLYVENNVYSQANQQSFQGENPFLLTHYDEYRELQKQISFKLLLDVAHLKVSCHSMGLDFATELTSMLAVSDYVHISDNDSMKDSNGPFIKDSNLYQLMQSVDLSGKTFTLEVYGGLDEIEISYQSLLNLIEII